MDDEGHEAGVSDRAEMSGKGTDSAGHEGTSEAVLSLATEEEVVASTLR